MVEKTTSSKASCSPRKTGLRVNKTESDDPKMVNARLEILKIPQNLFILAEARSARVRLYDVIKEVEQLLHIMQDPPIDPYFKNKMCTQIDAGEALLKEWQGKLDDSANIYSRSCNDITSFCW